MTYNKSDIESVRKRLTGDQDFEYAIENSAADVMVVVLYNNGYPRCYDLADAIIDHANN